MLRFTVQRLLVSIPTLLVLIALVFFLVRIAPGGPFDSERALPPEIEASMQRAYHLDEPLLAQFGRYLAGIARGNFGPSFKYREFTVTELIRAGFPVSLRLGVLALLVAVLLGVPAGIGAALRQNTAADHAAMAGAMLGLSVPGFVLAPVLVLVFAVGLGWLPAGGYEGGDWRHVVLPVLTLALPQVAYLARLTRASMIEVLQSAYIRTARAQGLPVRTIVVSHALKPALLPVISYLGPTSAAIVTGSVVIEQIFGLPGIGRFFVNGALNRDYTLVMGVVIFYGVLIMSCNFLVDLLYGLLDPRIRHTT